MATNLVLYDELNSGRIKFHELESKFGEDRATEIRLQYLKQKHNLNLDFISRNILSPKDCKPNIENMIGSAQVPLGVAGPLKVEGKYANGDFFLPLATTEGALVASVNRGCSVINKSGGAKSEILRNQQSRSILFKLKSVKQISEFMSWVKNNFFTLKQIGEQGERFIEVQSLDPYIIGLNVWLRLRAETKDAMGMNMVTISAKKIGDYINDNFDVEFISESGNMCVDKKPSFMNLINTRGKQVVSSVDITPQVIKETLRTTAENLIDLNYRKNLLGSAAAGSLGYNAHFANIVAALFIATGQDVAHTVEGSLGFTCVEKTDRGLNFSVTLPNLQIGTVGGGTHLPTQRECLALLGVQGPGKPPGSNSLKFAEIIGAAVLAGEISLLAALCTKELSKAHSELNR